MAKKVKLTDKRVAIVAMGRSNMDFLRMCAFSGDRGFCDEVWAVNSMACCIRHDLLFAMDDLKIQEMREKVMPNTSVGGSIRFLKTHPKFITSRAYPDYPGAIEFPLEEAINDLGGLIYFNSTVAYAIAYALLERVGEIQLYGVDFTYADAHRAEKGRGCCEMLMGIAHQRGVKIKLPHTTTLCDTNVPPLEKIYGYDSEVVTVTKNKQGRSVVERKDRETLPTVEEIEARYNYPAFDQNRGIHNGRI